MSSSSLTSFPNTLSHTSSNASEDTTEAEKIEKWMMKPPTHTSKDLSRPTLGFRRHSAACSRVPSSPEPPKAEYPSRTASFKKEAFRKMSVFGGIRTKATSLNGLPQSIIDPKLENSPEFEQAKGLYSDFSKLLETKAHIVGFDLYLQQCYSQENLAFYQRIQILKEEKSLIVAQSIYSEFISRNALTPVNIKSSTKRSITTLMENQQQQQQQQQEQEQEQGQQQQDKIPDNLLESFLEAQSEIFVLMEADSFQRFLNSHESKHWKLYCYDLIKEKKKSSFPKFHIHRKTVAF